MTDISFYNKGGLYVPLCQDDVIFFTYIYCSQMSFDCC